MLLWLFGPTEEVEVHLREPKRVSGSLRLRRARVRWFLSTDARDLPFTPEPGSKTTFRSITVNGEEIVFTEGFTDLHTRVYEEVLAGRGAGLDEARPSIELAHRIRHVPVTPSASPHPMLSRA
jgi:UDP-N-acetyl-2-amino-2-deoxyglucuronate dehydrogenase